MYAGTHVPESHYNEGLKANILLKRFLSVFEQKTLEIITLIRHTKLVQFKNTNALEQLNRRVAIGLDRYMYFYTT